MLEFCVDHARYLFRPRSRRYLKLLREDSREAYRAVGVKIQAEDVGEDAFSMEELESALRKLKNDAPGEDGIQPPALESLPPAARQRLFLILNRSWTKNRVPSCWMRAVTIRVLKKNKPQFKIKSYRFVSHEICFIFFPDLVQPCSRFVQTLLEKCSNVFRSDWDLVRLCWDLIRWCRDLFRSCQDLFRTCLG